MAGCLLLGAGFIAIIFSIFKSSDAHKVAENYLRENTRVQQVTGGIKDFGMMPSGNINVTNGYGNGDLTISVNAYKNDIDAHVILEKQPGAEWRLWKWKL